MEIEGITIKTEPEDSYSDYSSSCFTFTDEDSKASTSASFAEDTSRGFDSSKSENEEKYKLLSPFCFQSDHPLYRSNYDYKNLLATVALLQAQRSRAISDLKRLIRLEKEALADPFSFVERLQATRRLDAPGRQEIATVPDVDFDKYSDGELLGRRRSTHKTFYKDMMTGVAKSVKPEADVKPRSLAWTVEEQKRLEELLVLHPPEETEAKRWKKIACALGTRTPVQVASRVQKYFIKLTKAGMPVPGRIPSATHLKKAKRVVNRTTQSTFFASQALPVSMPTADDYKFISHPLSISENSKDSESDSQVLQSDEEISVDLCDTPEYKELVMLKTVEKERFLLQ